jgi:hypothetical protein
MNELPIDELYFTWLYNQVGDSTAADPFRTHWNLLRQLYQTEFVHIVDRDDNRLQDGRDLRQEFLDETGREADPEWVDIGCSMLELMLGLSRAASFEDLDAEEPRFWFWRLAKNAGLDQFNDHHAYPNPDVEAIADRVMYRTYNANGTGGFFPLKHPREDQRRVELWYQLNAYMIERYQA